MGATLPEKKLYGTATVGSKGQIVIPAEAREDLGIQPGDRLYIVNTMHSAGVMCIKEEMLAEMVNHLTAQIEGYKAIQTNIKQQAEKE
ncbi:MAG: AbrB/MazE/SpoVT family DNA-binding domain-containing protein [Candidatus Saccharimonadales bacterium]